MSTTLLNEKDSLSSSPDGDDSGHDSVDEAQSALDDRERISHLETAVAWIRGEVNNLKNYDQDILKELRKIRLTVHEIQDTQKEVKNEVKYLDDTLTDRSATPSSPIEPLPSLPTPSPEPFIASDGQRYRTGTLELLTTAPTHLKQKSDDRLLEEFFGSDQMTKLNDLTGEDSVDSAVDEQPLNEVKLREGSPKKLRIPINPNSGVMDRNRMSYDVASEMEQLRARIQEKARLELEDLDKKFSPKLSHPGFGLLTSSGSHSRQGSLDSSMPATTAAPETSDRPVNYTRHTRNASLPVFFDPSSVKKSPPSQLKTQMEHKRSEESDSRSPTPPLNYVHVRQASAGSGSSGTFSPPLTVVQPSHVISPRHHVTKPFSTPPLIRSPQRNVPQFQSLKERSLRPQSGKLPSAQSRDLAISHTHSNSTPSSLPNPLPSQFTVHTLRSGPGYSTTTVKGLKRTSPEGNKPNGHTALKPPLPANRALMMTRDLDQPEIKSIPRHTQLRRAPSGEKVAASPRMGRVPPISGPSHTHQPLGMRLSEPGNVANFQTNHIEAQVHPEDIQPYMTSSEVRGQMFKYTPFTDNIAKDKSKSLGSSNAQNRQNSNLLPNEQTWC